MSSRFHSLLLVLCLSIIGVLSVMAAPQCRFYPRQGLNGTLLAQPQFSASAYDCCSSCANLGTKCGGSTYKNYMCSMVAVGGRLIADPESTASVPGGDPLPTPVPPTPVPTTPTPTTLAPTPVPTPAPPPLIIGTFTTCVYSSTCDATSDSTCQTVDYLSGECHAGVENATSTRVTCHDGSFTIESWESPFCNGSTSGPPSTYPVAQCFEEPDYGHFYEANCYAQPHHTPGSKIIVRSCTDSCNGTSCGEQVLIDSQCVNNGNGTSSMAMCYKEQGFVQHKYFPYTIDCTGWDSSYSNPLACWADNNFLYYTTTCY